MKLLISACVFLICIFLVCFGHDRPIQKRKATKFLSTTGNVGLAVLSLAFDIYSFIDDEKDTAEILQKLNEISYKLDEVTENIQQTNLLLQTVLREISKTLYANAIIDAEREIDHCFDVLKEFTKSSTAQQAKNRMENCHSVVKYVKQVGKIASGQTIGFSSENLFDILIDQHKRCNGTELLGIQGYLSQLLIKGCSTVILADSLKYGNATQSDEYCRTAFNETDIFRHTLFKSCASESCESVTTHISSTLSSATSANYAFELLSKEFPWFYFMVIETPGKPDCQHDSFHEFGNELYNLQTYRCESRQYLVSYRDERYKSSGTGNPTGFELPQSCRIAVKNDMGFGISDIAGSTAITFILYEDNTVKSYSNICNNIDMECKKETKGTVASEEGKQTNTAITAIVVSVTITLICAVPTVIFCVMRRLHAGKRPRNININLHS